MNIDLQVVGGVIEADGAFQYGAEGLSSEGWQSCETPLEAAKAVGLFDP